MILSPDKDPMGTAIADYHAHKKSDRLRVFSSMFEEDEIPVKHLFRTYNQMSNLEKKALDSAIGRILDVGAGSGCHTLALQKMGHSTVCAIDISPASVKVMNERGVKDARLADLFDWPYTDRFDTILMLMNGIGIIGKPERMPLFFSQMRRLLLPGGSIWVDSSDLAYLYEDEEGNRDIDLNGEYYGLIDYQMQYKEVIGEPFDWLYIDFDTLSYYAEANGFKAERILTGKHYDYLARLMPKE